MFWLLRLSVALQLHPLLSKFERSISTVTRFASEKTESWLSMTTHSGRFTDCIRPASTRLECLLDLLTRTEPHDLSCGLALASPRSVRIRRRETAVGLMQCRCRRRWRGYCIAGATTRPRSPVYNSAAKQIFVRRTPNSNDWGVASWPPVYTTFLLIREFNDLWSMRS